MKDLTQDSIVRNILTMSAPIAIGMLFQTLYLLVDLYFVAALGDAAVAGVGAAGTLMFVVFALTQVLGVGAVALIAQAVGRKDQADANLVFNQSLVLAALCALLTLLFGYGLTSEYVGAIAADEATRAAGTTFLYFFLPGFALQFAIVTMSSALRGTGIVKPAMAVQALTVVLNTLLAPVLIAGWGTGWALGVAGAGLASSISVAVGVAMLTVYFLKLEKFVFFVPALWRPDFATWKRLLDVGLPAGGEFALMFIYMGVVYWVISDFGAAAQAAFGIGSRITQSFFMPAMAIAFAAGPIAGQNFGAGRPDRVRETFRKAVLLSFAVMGLVTALLQWRPGALIAFFSAEPEVQTIGAEFVRIISWTFLAQGVVFTCSGMFQGLGNTRPSLVSSGARMAAFVPLAVWLSTRPGFHLAQVWYVSLLTVVLQAGLSVVLLQGQFRRRLVDAPLAGDTVPADPRLGTALGRSIVAPAAAEDRPLEVGRPDHAGNQEQIDDLPDAEQTEREQPDEPGDHFAGIEAMDAAKAEEAEQPEQIGDAGGFHESFSDEWAKTGTEGLSTKRANAKGLDPSRKSLRVIGG